MVSGGVSLFRGVYMSNFKLDKKYLCWGITAFLVIVACIAFYSIIYYMSGIRTALRLLLQILSPFIMGAALAYILTPVSKFLQARLFQPLGIKLFRDSARAGKFGRGMAIGTAVILIVAFISVLLTLIIPQLISSIESLLITVSSSIDDLQNWADNTLKDYPLLETHFSDVLNDISGTITRWSKDTLLPQMTNIIASVSTGVINILMALVDILIAIAVSIYLMYNREKLISQAKKTMYSVFSPGRSAKILKVVRLTDKTFLSFFIGKLLDSLIIGIMCYIGCLLIGIKDSLLIAVIVGITNIIPVFGPFIGAVPSALIVLMDSPVKCLIFVIFIIVLQQFDGNFLGPKILGQKTGLSGLWVLFSIIVGAGLLGPMGMIVGVPAFAVIMAGARYIVNSRLRKRGLPTDTSNYDDLDYIDPETNALIKKPSPENAPSKPRVRKKKQTK